MTRQQQSKALEVKLIEAMRIHKIGFISANVIGGIVHVECNAASSANKAADVIANFCRKVSVWGSINDDDRANIHKVYRVAGRV